MEQNYPPMAQCCFGNFLWGHKETRVSGHEMGNKGLDLVKFRMQKGGTQITRIERIKKCRRCRLIINYRFLLDLVKYRMQKGGTQMTRVERIKKCRKCRLINNYRFLLDWVKFRMQKGGTRITRIERIKKRLKNVTNCQLPLPTFLTEQEYRDKGQGKTKGVGLGKISDAKRGNADNAD